jgi:hypothetical protein
MPAVESLRFICFRDCGRPGLTSRNLEGRLMDIQYREARAEDLADCVDLFLESLKDMFTRHGIHDSPLPPASEMLAFYEHARSTGIFHVAEAGGTIAALACAIVRDQLWFLCGFWARPELQRQHIGMPVLRSVWSAGKEAGATHYFVDASRDPTAIAAYLKVGMLPGCQMLDFRGTPHPFRDESPDYVVAPLDKSFVMDLDQTIRGTRREVDHDFFAATGSQGRQVSHRGESIGYYYFSKGDIGPAAWNEARHGEPLLTLACREASATGSDVSLQVPGMNHTAIRFALQSGLRLRGAGHLLMSAPFGRLEQYLSSGPALF